MKKSDIKKLQDSGQTAAYSRDTDCAYAYEVKILDVDATRGIYPVRGFALHTAPGIKIGFVSAKEGAIRTEVVASSMIKMTWAEYQERHAARMNLVQERKERLETSRKAAEYQAGRLSAAYEKATGEPPKYGQVTIRSNGTRLGEPTAYHVEVAPEVLDELTIPGAGRDEWDEHYFLSDDEACSLARKIEACNMQDELADAIRAAETGLGIDELDGVAWNMQARVSELKAALYEAKKR